MDGAEFRAQQITQGELWEELRVEHLWFHVVRGMILRGQIKEMGMTAWAVYCVLKAHTDLNTGRVDVTIEAIGEYLGVKHDTIQRAIKRLAELELITVEKGLRGQRNKYLVNERLPMISRDGQMFGYGERPYVGRHFESFVKELERFARSGNMPADKNITINVTFNVQNITQGDNSQLSLNITNINSLGDLAHEVSPEQAELISRLKKLKD